MFVINAKPILFFFVFLKAGPKCEICLSRCGGSMCHIRRYMFKWIAFQMFSQSHSSTHRFQSPRISGSKVVNPTVVPSSATAARHPSKLHFFLRWTAVDEMAETRLEGRHKKKTHLINFNAAMHLARINPLTGKERKKMTLICSLQSPWRRFLARTAFFFFFLHFFWMDPFKSFKIFL